MFGILCTVDGLTKRLCLLNRHVPGYTGFAFWVGHKAGVHAPIHFPARIGKGGLRNGVVLLHEDKHDHIANCCGDGLGCVAQYGRHSGLYRLETTDGDLLTSLSNMS